MVKNAKSEEFDPKVMQANFSAVLYLVTEQQALIGRLIRMLLEKGAMNTHELAVVTDITEGEEGLVPAYTQIYNRFATYYLRTKRLLDAGGVLESAVEEAIKSQDLDKDKDNEEYYGGSARRPV